MSSLPLLNTSGSAPKTNLDMGALMCSPAVLVLVVGSGLVVYDIVRGHTRQVGGKLLGTLLVTLIVGVLCISGLESVSWAVVMFPVVMVLSLVVLIVLTLMLTEPEHSREHRRPRPLPRPSPRPKNGGEPTLKDAYRYVMTGKGFATTLGY